MKVTNLLTAFLVSSHFGAGATFLVDFANNSVPASPDARGNTWNVLNAENTGAITLKNSAGVTTAITVGSSGFKGHSGADSITPQASLGSLGT